jgi:hypothetical protein
MNVGREREIPPDYCYKKLDQIALKQITDNCRNKSFAEDKLQELKKRILSSKAQLFVPAWVEAVRATVNPSNKISNRIISLLNEYKNVM